MGEWAAILGGTGAAIVTGVFAVFGARFRKENTVQHSDSLARLDNISERISEVRDDVKEVRRRQDDHLEWHAEHG
jgi:hypothetical protein